MSTLDTLNTPTPTRLLDEVELVGHPYHGLVQSGMLTLPNGDTLIYRQPSSADAWAIHLAGVPELTRTTEQLEQDAELGHQWLHKVVLSGRVPQVYGKALVGAAPAWLWRDSAGVVWQFSLPALTTYQTEIRVTYRKFGRFGEEAYPPVNVDLAHAIDTGDTDVDLRANGEDGSTVPRVCDINEDGSSVIVGLYHVPPSQVYSGAWTLPAPVERAAGFVRIDVSSGTASPNVSLTTVRNNLQTLGSIEIGDSADPPDGTLSMPTDQNGNPIGVLTESRLLSISGRIVSMYFEGSSIKEISISYFEESSQQYVYDQFSVSYGSATYTPRERFEPLSSSWQISLEVDGVTKASYAFDTLTPPAVADGFSTPPPTYNYVIVKAGTRQTYYEAGRPRIPERLRTLAEGQTLSASYILNRGAWQYSKKLWCLFSISNSGVVTWSDAFAPGASAPAQPPLGGGWTWNPSVGTWYGGPATWYRAQDPITGEITGAYSSPVCFV